MTQSELELVIENWVRWSRTRYRLGHAQSLEGRYRSRQPWDILPTARGPIDKAAAEETEDAWKAIPSVMHKLIIKWDYVFLRPVWGICKSLRIKGYALNPLDYDIAKTVALRYFSESLDNQKKTAQYSAENSTTVYDVSPAMIGGRTACVRIPKPA